ncbi:DUF262 domain-containing protein [Flavobacterium johnsoniae]|uniref:DUF262 domain-containing protein n=1 Tax=Flavobacterium johnsoniae TaxID=986 RepID=UPI0025B1D204|nr:DUF262 domain-containing protein [Flavobacterium johnsoniae]WJS93389.1 DUF262 domain-containing protein [Flavobacterium johnsoniae]
MKYTITKWTVEKLLLMQSQGDIILSPPYQRNFIWSIKDQQYLIDSIIKGSPIPNFFLLEKADGKLEMVDGQQRSRTILSFISGQFTDLEGKTYSAQDHPTFLNYEFPVTIITDTEGEQIEKFYALVNKTGVHLNKPEVRKADYYDTNFLNLINEISTSKKVEILNLFSEGSLKRMNDTDFISELIVLIKIGHVDKKNHIDEYFKSDIRTDEASEIKITFNSILDKINLLNKTFEVSKTRYKQRNDFYTLFNFILDNSTIDLDVLKYFYKILVLISKDIKPTQDNCEPLKEYARNCVTQSNSKLARENRLNFFNELLLNKNLKANKTQKLILKFYNLDAKNIVKVGAYTVIDIEELNKIKNITFKR